MTEIEILTYYINQERKLHKALMIDLDYLKNQLKQREEQHPVGHVLIQSAKNAIEKKQMKIIETTDRFLALEKTMKTIKGEN